MRSAKVFKGPFTKAQAEQLAREVHGKVWKRRGNKEEYDVYIKPDHSEE